MNDLAVIDREREGFLVEALPHPLRADRFYCEAPHGLTLAELLPDAHEQVEIWVGGERVPRASWSRVRPRAGIVVTVRAVAAGGGGKKVLRTVLQVAIVAAALYFTGPGALFASSLANAAVAAGIVIGGNLLLNALIPPPLPSAAGPGESFNRRNAVTGTRNQANPYGAVPRVLGRHRYYPPFAALPYTEVLGENQYLRVLLMLGYGELNISDIRIGQTPINEFEGVEWEIGETTDLFASAASEEALAIALDATNDTGTRTTELDADEISLDLGFPVGLFGVTDKGKTRSVQVRFRIEYREVGSGTWLNVRDATGLQYSAGWASPFETDQVQITGAVRETRRIGIRWKVDRGQYEVRVTRTTTALHAQASTDPDNQFHECIWTVLRSFTHVDPSAVPGTLKLAVRIRATDQLQGITDRINLIAESVLPIWTGVDWVEAGTSNPAWCYLEVAAGEATAEPMDRDERFALDELRAWADECTAAGREYSAVIDAPTTVFELMRDIAAVGRAARSIRDDGRHTVIRDLPDQPHRQTFTPRNSWGFSGRKVFQSLPDALRIRFVNPAADWQLDELIVYRDGFDEGTAQVYEVLELRGVTLPEQAWREGTYHLLSLEERDELFELSCDVENLAARRGDLVLVAHDVLEVGVAWGRIKATEVDGMGHAIELTLDEPVTMEAATDYVVRVRRQDGSSVLQAVTLDVGEGIAVITPTAPMEDVEAGDLFVFGVSGIETERLKITEVRPGANLSAKLIMVAEAPALQGVDLLVPPAFETSASAVIDPALIQCCPPVISLPPITDAIHWPFDVGGIRLPQFTMQLEHQDEFEKGMAVERYEVRIRPKDMVDGWRHSFYPANGGLINVPGIEVEGEYVVQARCWPEGARPSAWAEIEHTVVGPDRAPQAPTLLTGISRTKGILLQWTPGDVSSEVRWRVYSAPHEGGAPGAWELVATVASPEYLDPVTDGSLRWHRVTAADYEGVESAPSNEVLSLSWGPLTGQNLLGAGNISFSSTGAGFTIRQEDILLSELGMVAGDVFSFAAKATVSNNTTARNFGLWVDFINSVGGGVGTINDSNQIADGTGVSLRENMVIPAGTHWIRFRWVRRGGTGTSDIDVHWSMANRGPVSLPFEFPPTRVRRGEVNFDGVVSAIADDDITYASATQPQIEATGINEGASLTPAVATRVHAIWSGQAQLSNTTSGVAVGEARLQIQVLIDGVVVYQEYVVLEGFRTSNDLWAILSGGRSFDVPAGEEILVRYQVYRDFGSGGSSPAQTIYWRECSVSLLRAKT